MPQRVTLTTLMVLEEILRNPRKEWYAWELSELLGFGSSTVVLMLLRLEGEGWFTSRMEDLDTARSAGRPSRHYFKLTAQGEKEARKLLQERGW